MCIVLDAYDFVHLFMSDLLTFSQYHALRFFDLRMAVGGCGHAWFYSPMITSSFMSVSLVAFGAVGDGGRFRSWCSF